MKGVRFYQEFENKAKSRPTGGVVAVLDGETETDKRADCFYSLISEEKARRLAPEMAEATKQKVRLEYLRGELRAERISWAELADLQSLVEFIEPGDTELLEAAGVPE